MGGLACPDFKTLHSAASPHFALGARLVGNASGVVFDYGVHFLTQPADVRGGGGADFRNDLKCRVQNAVKPSRSYRHRRY